MDKRSKKDKTVLFWITEIVLLIASAFFAFGLVGYRTIAMVLAAVFVLVGIYRLLSDYSKKNAERAKMLRTVLTSLVLIGLAIFTVIEIPIVGSAHTDDEPEAPYLIVLGAGVNGTEPSLSLTDRLKAAKQYLNDYPESIAVVSGAQGDGEDITEAECMRRWLEQNGISADRIIMETEAASTYDNIKYSLKKIRENGGDPTGKVAIASSEYHLYRAKYIARGLGADALGISGHTTYLVLMINYFIREAVAVAVLWIM